MVSEKWNIFLSLIAMLVILAYVIIANMLVSQKYLLNSLKAEFGNRSTQSANVKPESDIEFLINFAKTSGLVEAKDTAAILMYSTFALDGQ